MLIPWGNVYSTPISETDLWPPIENGWLSEAKRLALDHHWSFSVAYDHVTAKYLLEGDTRALLYGVLKLCHRFRPSLLMLVASMMRPQDPDAFMGPTLPFVFEFKPIRKRGRPPRNCAVDKRIESAWFALSLTHLSLCAGSMPHPKFWVWLAAELEVFACKSVKGQIPIQAKIISASRLRGRRADPELEERDLLLSAAVENKMRNGAKYESAIDETVTELKRFKIRGSRENIPNHQTVRDAYDRHHRKS